MARPTASAMRTAGATFLLALGAAGSAAAQTPPTTPQTPTRPTEAPSPEIAPIFAEAPPAGTEAPGGGYNPQMLGDSLSMAFGTYFRPVTTTIVVDPEVGPVVATKTIVGSSNPFGTAQPLPGALSSFKIAENESPFPQDRVFTNFKYFVGISHSLTPNVHVRAALELFGFEKTFLDGDASVELRVPFYQIHSGSEALSLSDLGDVTLIGKFALLRSQDGIISSGLALTLPTAPAYYSGSVVVVDPAGVILETLAPAEKVNPTFIQPFVGWSRNAGDWYAHGFTSVAFSSDASMSHVMFNDVGLGWYAYRGANSGSGAVVSIVPTTELHLTTPFGHRGSDGFPVAQIDALIAVLGTHFIFDRSVLTFGYEFPLTGPQPFSSELVAQLNWRF